MESFILQQLQRAGIAPVEGKKIYLRYKDIFIQSLTHKTFGDNNYEMLEAYGDKVINTSLFDILHKKYPTLDQKSITFAFHKAKSEEILYKEGEKVGFFPFIRMSDEYKAQVINWRDNFQNPDFQTNTDKNLYIKLLEDVVESFCGAMSEAVNKYTGCFMGPGIECVYKWAIPIVENLSFDPTNVEETQNEKMQVKEFWDVVYAPLVYEQGHRNANFKMFPKDEEKSRLGQVWVNICDPVTRRLLGYARGYNQSDAELNAAKQIFPVIKQQYAKEFLQGQEYILSKKNVPPVIRGPERIPGRGRGNFRGRFPSRK